jgi:hypothetical protein
MLLIEFSCCPDGDFIGVLGLDLYCRTFSSGLSTWKEQVRFSSTRIIAPLLLNSPQ